MAPLTIRIPWISVVIPTYGRVGVGLTKECLESLTKTHEHLGGMEVYVVDDGSPADVQSDLYTLCQSYGAGFVGLDDNGGFAKTCNAGIVRCSGQTVFLLNNDVTFEAPALQVLGDTLMHPGVGVAGCRLLYPDRTIQHGGVTYVPGPAGNAIPGWFDHIARGAPEWHPEAVCHTQSLVTGACFGISRVAINVIGLLDERYGMAAEDIDYCLEVQTAGMQTIYNGYIWAIHAEGQTRGRTPEEKMALNPKAWQVEREGLVKFFQKWNALGWPTLEERVSQ